MTKCNTCLGELLQTHNQGDFLCPIADAILQRIMEAEVGGAIRSRRRERVENRRMWRDGDRDRDLYACLGTLILKVSKPREQSYISGLLETKKMRTGPCRAVPSRERSRRIRAGDKQRAQRPKGIYLPDL